MTNIIIFIMKVKLHQRQKIPVKDLLKKAIKITPQAVVSLKRSLSVNQANLDSFMNCLQEYSQKKEVQRNQRHQSFHKYNQNMLNTETKQEQHQRKIPTKRQIFMRHKMLTNKTIRHELKMKRNQIKIDAVHQYKSYRQRSINDLVSQSWKQNKASAISVSASQCILAPNPNNKEPFQHRRAASIVQRRRVNTQESNRSWTQQVSRPMMSTPGSTAQRFWKKRDNSAETNQIRLKTEPVERKTDGSLRELTCFSPEVNRQAINKLVLHLQINLEYDRRKQIIARK